MANDEASAVWAQHDQMIAPVDTAEANSDVIAEEDSAVTESADSAVETHTSNETSATESAEETQEEGVQAEPEISADPETEDVVDDGTIENGLPTRESLENFPRTNPEAKAKMVELWDAANADREKIQSLGGEQGVEVLTPVGAVLQKNDTTYEERMGAVASIVKGNPVTATYMFADAAEQLLGDPDLRQVGDTIAQKVFGTDVNTLNALSEVAKTFNADPSHIQELLKLEQAGLINRADDMELFNANYGGSELYQQQMEQIRQLKEERDNAINNPRQQETVQESNAGQELDTEFLKRFETAVAPVKGKADAAFDKWLTKGLIADLKDDPDYKTALAAAKQIGSVSLDNMAIGPALNRLSAKARGRYQEAVRERQAERKTQSTQSHNAQLKEKTEATKPKAISMPQKTSTDMRSSADEQADAIFDRFSVLRRDAALAAARSV